MLRHDSKALIRASDLGWTSAGLPHMYREYPGNEKYYSVSTEWVRGLCLPQPRNRQLVVVVVVVVVEVAAIQHSICVQSP